MACTQDHVTSNEYISISDIIKRAYISHVTGLMKTDADLYLMNNGGWNSLQLAAQGGNSETIAQMLTHVPHIESRCAENLSLFMILFVNCN